MTQFRPSRFEILPTIVKNLLIINGLFFLAQNVIKGPATGFSFDDTFALHAWQSGLFRPWQLITHMFLHSTNDFGHILGNMFALWMFGSVLENLWGSKRFLVFYLICGLGAALMHLLFLSYELVPMMRDYNTLFQLHTSQSPAELKALAEFIQRYNLRFVHNDALLQYLSGGENLPELNLQIFKTITAYYQENVNQATLGASGAVFGVLAAFVYLFPNTYLYIYFLVPVKVKWVGLIYFSYELFYAVRNSAGDNVARWAHVGGAIVGLLIVISWNKTNRKTFY